MWLFHCTGTRIVYTGKCADDDKKMLKVFIYCAIFILNTICSRFVSEDETTNMLKKTPTDNIDEP